MVTWFLIMVLLDDHCFWPSWLYLITASVCPIILLLGQDQENKPHLFDKRQSDSKRGVRI